MSDRAPVVYLDSNAIIYFIEGEPDLVDILKPLFQRLTEMPGAAVTSEITLAEVLAPSGKSGWPVERKRSIYLHLIVWRNFIRLYPVSRDVLYETIPLRTAPNLKLIDAVHLATAVMSGCRYFLTADKRLRVVEGIERVAPDEHGIRSLLKVLA